MNEQSLTPTIEGVERERSTAADLVIADLAAENAQLIETNAALVDIIADLTYQNFQLAWVGDYRCRHSSSLLNILTRAARAGLQAAA